jgi:hypothetical protein
MKGPKKKKKRRKNTDLCRFEARGAAEKEEEIRVWD